MRYIFLTMMVTWFSIEQGLAQELVLIRDTINKFQIGVPEGWQYGVPTGNYVDLIAYRQKINNEDVVIENFNINVFESENTNFKTSYIEFIKTIGEAKGFEILEQGNKKIFKRKYKYLIETHENPLNKEATIHYVLFTNNDGKIVILTMVASPLNFQKYKPLFDKIALSLRF
ncbi:hypothetical protein [Haliscomenobacter hydrossis]|uniref:PsbP C-terminal domain-containing protein n=1 Tax=Haliscomenobacter hydrossis (strain ATCC 27775 / DSM 1100 / LMG 10767 / O) TaxID=760192 RepID=F4L1I0_HALH1|nr:hypothetical protein [Haliscomenobacter hydrossis]AEE48524.1 hypothetical protein Halhy_0615 [Haliscomenobacter hydrossis DSM 1100]